VPTRVLAVLPLLLLLTITGPPAADAGATAAPARAATPLDCAEPVGQTDTPPHPRLHRAVVVGTQVAVVVPPGYGEGSRRYPVLYLLHGAQGDEDSWIEYGGLLEDSAARPRSDQAIVVMPKVGPFTGFALDWVDGHRQDATLIGERLVDWVDATFRTVPDRRHRAIAGYSGGGLSAAHLAESYPEVFGQLGVFSGPVDLGEPVSQLAAFVMLEAEKLCAGAAPTSPGPLGSPTTHPAAWAAADPVRGAAALRDTTVWLSSGNGVPCSLQDAGGLLTNPTALTEPQMRRLTDSFSAALTAAGVTHTNRRRGCGLHWWTRWRPDLAEFWGVAATEWRRARP